MSEIPHILFRSLQKFERRNPLDAPDRTAFLKLPFRTRVVEPNQYIVREGDIARECCLILDGFAYRQKTTVEGARQILSLHLAGDFVDLEAVLLRQADYSVQALTRCEIALISVADVRKLRQDRPPIAQAMWVDNLIDAAISREWILNVGQRNAKARIAHIICEFARRMEMAGLGKDGGYEFPMTQEQLGDATGLTQVHINRILRTLETDGLIERKRRLMHVPDWHRLRTVAGFSATYLHLDQVGP